MEIFQNRRAVTQTQAIALVAVLIVAVTAAWYYYTQRTPPTDTEWSVSLISQASYEENQTIYHVSIDWEDLAPREAEIRVYHNPQSNGTVFFVTGGWGLGWYGDSGELQEQTINAMQENNYETCEIRWLGETGWGTDNFGQGFKKLTGGHAAVIRWILAEVANNPNAVGAIGHSAGCNILAYGLALHGLETILDVVVLSAGPSMSNLTRLCEERYGIWRFVDYVMGWQNNGDYCRTCLEQHGNNLTYQFPDEILHSLQVESIVSPLTNEVRDFDYPTTQVVFLEGELDVVTDMGLLFYETITCEKSWVLLIGVGHGALGDPEGAATIQEKLLEGLGSIP